MLGGGETNNAAPLETYKRRGRAEGGAWPPLALERKGNRAPGRKTKGGVASITRKSLASKGGGRGARSRAAEMRMGEGVFEVSSCVVGGLRESGEFGIWSLNRNLGEDCFFFFFSCAIKKNWDFQISRDLIREEKMRNRNRKFRELSLNLKKSFSVTTINFLLTFNFFLLLNTLHPYNNSSSSIQSTRRFPKILFISWSNGKISTLFFNCLTSLR